MQYPGYNTGNILLVEGETYPFIIHNIIQLQDGADYYVLTDINGMKHFMPSFYYVDYGFKIGEEISCKIDRINCTGRIFLEPVNPFYKESEIYIFDLERCITQGTNITLIVKGINESRIEVPVSDLDISSLASKKKVSCKVQNIKKGKLILEFHCIYA